MSDTHVLGLTIKDYGQQVASDAAIARKQLEEKYGQVWDTQQLGRDFEVHSFAAPFIIVTRRVDKKRGTLEFSHNPRFYFGFEETVR